MFNKSTLKEHKRIVHLLLKYLKGELTLKEQQTMEQWAAESEKNLKLLQDVADQQTLASEMASFSNFEWNDIAQKLAANGVPITETTKVRHSLYWGRFMVAAAVLLIMAVASYLIVENNRKPPSINKTQVAIKYNDISPGKYKALLRLADGSTIVLDSNGSDSLTKQGEAKLANKNGQLIYKAGGKYSSSSLPFINTLTTAKAETYQLVLSDGSKVWLNSESSIRFPVYFNGTERKVEVSGEAYFEVAHNSRQPFIAQVNGMEIKVLGTVFNVKAYPEENKVTTTLLQGKVQVTKEKRTQVLAPGEQADLLASGRIHLNKHADIEKAVGWREGIFIFKKDDVKYVMTQLARWYDFKVEYKGVINDRFTGIIDRRLPVSVVLDMLQKSTVHFQIKGRVITVISE